MGSYGIEPARIMAAAIEQYADDQEHLLAARDRAPSTWKLVTLGKEGEEARAVADALYEELLAAGLDTLYDDRASSAGEVRRRRAARHRPLRSDSG